MTGGTARISRDSVTGQATFLRTRHGQPLRQPFKRGKSADPETVARDLLSLYGPLFGLRRPDAELSLSRISEAANGRTILRFTQTNGLPVFAAKLIVHLDKNQDVLSVNGRVAAMSEDETPLFFTRKPSSHEQAARQAITLVAKKYAVPEKQLSSTEAKAWIFNPSLVHAGEDRNSVVWQFEVGSASGMIRELVLIDAKTNTPAYNYSLIHEAKDRRTYDNRNDAAFGLPGNGPVRSEGDPANPVREVNNAHAYAGDTYDFYATHHGRDSLDDAGMTLISTVRVCPSYEDCPYANAFWNGSQMAYGDGFAAADDVVGHELTHGVTEFTSDLIYLNQSGAINESFSDLWGEFVDLSNNSGDDSAAVRWLIGEDIPGYGAIRDMADPPAFGDPDRIGSSNYYCGSNDSGGVHTNSGVNNKAVALMADGGTFNGRTVNGIGIVKTAKIYYEVQTNLLTPSSTYVDLYNALQSACSALIGSDGITAGDCGQVLNAITAVEMDVPPCVIAPAPICDGGAANHLFFDDFENGLGNWSHSATVGQDVWELSGNNPGAGTRHLHGADPYSVSDSSVGMISPVTLPANAYLHFMHDVAMEETYDGGVLQYSTDGGNTWTDAGPLFTHNGYNGTLSTSYGNPLGGRAAMTVSTDGYTASRLDLGPLAGESVLFFYRIGTDSSISASGWDIDNVRIYTCNGGVPEITSPSPGSILPGTSVPFSWEANMTPVTEWWLSIGSTVGADDIYDSGSLAAATTSHTATGLPANGSAVHARLWYRNGGSWLYADTRYTAHTAPGLPEITTPAPGSTLPGTSATFSWVPNSSAVTEWWLYLGSSLGAKDIDDSGSLGLATSYAVDQLPADGSTVYARLYYFEDQWKHIDATYTAYTFVQPELTSPSPGATLPSANQTFIWDAHGANVSSFWLEIGSSPGGKDIYSSGDLGSATNATVNGLPTDGSALYVRLWYRINGEWGHRDYHYTALGNTDYPQIVSPINGSHLSSASETFSWIPNSFTVEKYWLYVGSSVGGKDILDSGDLGTATSAGVTGLPSDGSTVYVRLWYFIGTAPGILASSWYYDDYTYTSAGGVRGFSEQFNGDIANWGQHSGIWTNANSRFLYAENSSQAAGQWASTSYNLDTYSDLDYAARLWRDGDGSTSNIIFIRANGNYDTYGSCATCYRFQYNRSGSFSVWKIVNGNPTALQEWVTSSAIVQGSAWNRLRVVAQGSNLYFWINNSLVWSGTDAEIPSGRVGIAGYKSTVLDLWADWAGLSIPAASSATPGVVSDEQQRLNEAANANPAGSDPNQVR